MIESELKFWNINTASVATRLNALGRLQFSSLLSSLYFLFPKTKPDTLFRVRSFCGMHFICAKGERMEADTKSRPEYETRVSSPQVVAELVEYIGGKVCAEPEERWREQWEFNKCVVCIDSLADVRVPPYIEIEGPDSDQILDTATRLGVFESRGAKCGSLSFEELANEFGVTFKDLQRPLPSEVVGRKTPFWERKGELSSEGDFLYDRKLVCNGKELILNAYVAGGALQFTENILRFENPTVILEFLKLARVLP